MPSKIRPVPPDPNPSGLCQCGCGAAVPLWKRTYSQKGVYAGHHTRYLAGHHLRKSPLEYIEVDNGFGTHCWEWQRSINVRFGYGVKCISGGRTVRAHRWYYEQAHGDIPSGLDLDHLCRVRHCVNPDHLEPVSRAVNSQRGDRAKVTPDIVREIRRLSPKNTHVAIAKMLDVSVGIVGCIVRGETWRNVK